MSKLLQFLRLKKCANYKQLDFGEKKLLALNYNDEKMLEFYTFDLSEPTLICKTKPKKKIQSLWTDSNKLFAIDKFGDVYWTTFESLNGPSAESKFEDVFKLIASLFSESIDLKITSDRKYIVQTDDYYKIRVLDKKNVQRIHLICSLRNSFACRFFETTTNFIIFFDDFKIFSFKKEDLTKIDEKFDEGKLIMISKIEKEHFFDELQQVNENTFLGIYFNSMEKSAEIHLIKVNLNEGTSFVEKMKKIEEVGPEFCLVENEFIHFDNISLNLKDLK